MASRGHHNHQHKHNHGHQHGQFEGMEMRRPLLSGIIVNLVFALFEAGYGIWSGSVALLADAGHNATDIIGLVIAYLSLSISGHRPRGRFTYGLGNTTILAAISNALLLLIAAGAIAWEAIERLGHQSPPISGYGITLVALLAILVNGATALMLHRGRKEDLNMQAAYLHMLGDALISLGVVATGLLIAATNWNWLDAAASLLIVFFIGYSTWGILRNSIHLMLGAVPHDIQIDEVAHFLGQLPGVEHLHDLHIWPLSTRETALTVHLVMPNGYPSDAMLAEFAHKLDLQFGIGHATFQIERDAKYCPLQGESA